MSPRLPVLHRAETFYAAEPACANGSHRRHDASITCTERRSYSASWKPLDGDEQPTLLLMEKARKLTKPAVPAFGVSAIAEQKARVPSGYVQASVNAICE